MADEYNPEDLEELVSQALSDIEETENYSLFAFGETRILHHLDQVLSDYVDRVDAVNIVDSLREKMYEGGAGHADTPKSLRALHGVVSRCRVCPNVEPEPHLPKWNRTDPDVAFVMDTPLRGTEPEKFFVNELKETGFRSTRLTVTSVIRCFPQQSRPPAPDEISSCSTRYLFSEMQLLKPRLIVALGSIPASTLTTSKVKVREERGSIFWVGPWPILVTYSPGYAVRGDNQKTEFKSDLKRAYEFLYGK